MEMILMSALLGFAGHRSRVRCDTTAGQFTVTLDPSLSPLGVARFRTLVDDHFFDDMLLYRVIGNFLVQVRIVTDHP